MSRIGFQGIDKGSSVDIDLIKSDKNYKLSVKRWKEIIKEILGNRPLFKVENGVLGIDLNDYDGNMTIIPDVRKNPNSRIITPLSSDFLKSVPNWVFGGSINYNSNSNHIDIYPGLLTYPSNMVLSSVVQEIHEGDTVVETLDGKYLGRYDLLSTTDPVFVKSIATFEDGNTLSINSNTVRN